MDKNVKRVKNSNYVSKHNLVKVERGAITLYVTIVCLFILIVRNSWIYKYK